MKKISLALSTLCFLAACGKTDSSSHVASVGASSDDTIVTCQSIDPTFSPYYGVKVRPFDPTFPGSYLLEIAETDADAFPGPVTIQHQRETHGSALNNGVGQLTFDDGKLVIKRLANGELKGDMTFGSESDIEMTCQLSAVIQPVAGVSN